jgi:hypothetical protein
MTAWVIAFVLMPAIVVAAALVCVRMHERGLLEQRAQQRERVDVDA